MIDVEVRGRFGQYIKASLRNVVESDVIVSYPNGNVEERVALSRVRLPPQISRDVQAGQEAEVLFILPDLQFHPDASSNGASKSAPQSIADGDRSHLSHAAWWPCRVQKVRDDVAAVKIQVFPPSNSTPDEVALCAHLSSITDIVNRSTLRQSSHGAPALTASMIHRYAIEIPKEMADYAADLSVHAEFLKHCGEPISVYFDTDVCALVVLSTNENAIRNVPLLEETHLKMLRQKWAITRTLRQTMRSLEASRGHDGHLNVAHSRSGGDWEPEPGTFVEKFYVPQHLMGLAIGSHGSNIRSAREIPGVLAVRLQDSGEFSRRGGELTVDNVRDYHDAAMFIVEAKTPEAAKQARAKLEFTELYLGVPRRYVGRLIGRRTSNISSIIEKSGVVQIHFDDHIQGPSDDEPVLNVEGLNLNHSAPRTPSPNIRRVFLKTSSSHAATNQSQEDEEYGGFILSGTRESVERARLLFSFQLDYISDLERMEEEKSALLRNLSHSGPESGNGYPPRSRSGEWPANRGSRGVRRPPRGGAGGGMYPSSGGGAYPGMSAPESGPYDDTNPGLYRGGRRPPRDSRNIRGYNGDAQVRRPPAGRGSGRRGTDWNDRAGSNGDVADRRRGSQDSDTMGSNPSHEEDELPEISAPRARAARVAGLSKRGPGRAVMMDNENNDLGQSNDSVRPNARRSADAESSRSHRGRARPSNGDFSDSTSHPVRPQRQVDNAVNVDPSS